ncbi:hypothetical protein [Actinopolymorpha singaporensis]|uniref:Phasin domain-containing protein n=1 Tax=Actinopolymorpha singaporensis TaxID=117157 RepID=A0A1H1LSY7_9ACTN|nr:hypothetical protein [Actinopolymorpha singaporensis]SDR77105.1 hypothetical protein SAMN04489717_0488 [Actinopolymorpha singaporensis]
MPRTTRNKNISETITPLYVLAGAGDLAVEKIREISRMASSKISSLETTDPAEVSDRMQVRLEEGADTLGVVIRSATSDIREQAKGISGRAQSAMQAMWMSAGDAYEDLIERGEGVMSHLRGQNGRTIQRAAAGARGGRSTAAKKAGRSAGKATGTKSTAKKSASKTGGRSTTKSASKSTRSASKSTTRKRAASKGGRADSSSSANTRRSTASASKSAPAGAARPANSNTSAGTTTTSTSSTPTTNSSTSS